MPLCVSLGLQSSYAQCKLRCMTLDAFLAKKTMTAAALAETVGVSAASITRIRRGDQNISLDLARRIEVATAGMVTLNDLAMERAA